MLQVRRCPIPARCRQSEKNFFERSSPDHESKRTKDLSRSITIILPMTPNTSASYTLTEAMRKAEHYCVYQERCHKEVIAKLQTMRMIPQAIDVIVVHLIEHDFLNETRFACSFARGKHRIKYWGKLRIIRELKQRGISEYNIKQGLKELDPEEYFGQFESLSERHWQQMSDTSKLTKRKKFCDFMLRKGYESDLIYEKVRELEKGSTGQE